MRKGAGYDRTRVAPRDDLDQPDASAARTLFTAVGVALGVGLIVALFSISSGVQQTVNNVIHLGGADFGLFQGQVTELTNSLLPDQMAARVAADPGVKETAGIKLLVTTVDGPELTTGLRAQPVRVSGAPVRDRLRQPGPGSTRYLG